jgi:hypothetical protein
MRTRVRSVMGSMSLSMEVRGSQQESVSDELE